MFTDEVSEVSDESRRPLSPVTRGADPDLAASLVSARLDLLARLVLLTMLALEGVRVREARTEATHTLE